MKCQNCDNTTFYNLANEYIKCKKCAKKYSLKKIQKEQDIINVFCENSTAHEGSIALELNYKTVKNGFDEIRYKIAKFLEDEYNKSIKDYSEYQEYYYFTQKQKSKKIKSLYEAINILGFHSNDKVFTLLMPRLTQVYESSNKEFDKYLSWNKIYSKEFYKTKLYDFWKYLEENLKKYKGIEKDNFFFYLKECEFKFNYKKEEQLEILKNL